MAERRPTTIAEAIDFLYTEVRRLRKLVNSPRTKVQIESWTITDDASGNLVLRHENGTTYTFSATGPSGPIVP